MFEVGGMPGVNENTGEAGIFKEGAIGHCAAGVFWSEERRITEKEKVRGIGVGEDHDADSIEVARGANGEVNANSLTFESVEVFTLVGHKHIRAAVQSN